MKKFTLILSLLVAMVTTAMADEPAELTVDTNSYYTISFVTKGNGMIYLKDADRDNLYYEASASTGSTEETKYHFLFTLAGTAADGRKLYYISPKDAPEYFAYNTNTTKESGAANSVGLTNDATVKEEKGKWFVLINGTSHFIAPAWTEDGGTTYTRAGYCWNGWSNPGDAYKLGMWGRGTSVDDYFNGDNQLHINKYVSYTENEYTYTINAETGTLNAGRTGWSTSWTSEDGHLTLSVGAANMTSTNDDPTIHLYVGQSNSSTYKITAPNGYYVSSYSFDYDKVDDNIGDHEYYITQNGVKYYPSAEDRTLRVNNLAKKIVEFGMAGANKGIHAKNFTVTIKKFALPELTTDTNNPIYYTIQSARTGKYVKYRDNTNWLKQNARIVNQSLFYFTGEVLENGHLKVKIHNKATDNKMANFAEWNTEGTDWYIRLIESGYGDYPGYAISKADELTGNTRDSWNSRDSDEEVGDYWSNDSGCGFVFTPYVEHKEDLPQLSTENNKVYYYIKNLRHGKYATYDGEGNSIKLKDNKAEYSYWYFVENPAVEAPEGYVACYIFNAANAKQVENPGTGVYGENNGAYKTYYIKQHIHADLTAHNSEIIGFAIYPYDEVNAGWNDASGQGVQIGCYNYDDMGSIWYFEPVGHTESSLFESTKTSLNDKLTTVNNINGDADFYVYKKEDVNNAVNSINTLAKTNLLEALSSVVTAESKIAELRAKTDRERPIEVGKRIMLKNKQYNSFLQINGDKLNGNATATAQANDYATVWVVEEGNAEGQVKLKNLKNGKYIGQIRQSEDVPMVDAENAKEFTIERINGEGCYIAFHETTGGDHAYGHIDGYNVLVGWEKGANSSQWIAIESDLPADGSSFRIESSYQNFMNNQGVTKAVYANGENPGWKTLDTTDKNFYWTAEEVRGEDGVLTGYAIKNANNGKYLNGGANQGNAWTFSETPVTMKFEALTNYNSGKANEVNITATTGNWDLHANSHSTGNGNNGNIVSYNNGANTPSAWYIVPVANVDEAIINEIKNIALAIMENKGKVGYPVDSYYEAFAQAVEDATTNDEINAAKTVLYAATEVNMPVDGKAYYIKAKFLDGSHTYVFYNETDNAVRNEANKTDLSATFIFRDLKNDNKYAIAHNNGKYLVFYADGKSGAGNVNNGFANSYELGDHDAEYKLIRAATRTSDINGFSGDVNTQFFGGFMMQAYCNNGQFFYLMAGKESKKFHDAGSNAFYHQNTLSSVFYLEEAEYPNTVNLTAYTEDDELISINGSSIATFSAPFPTVVPENVKAYIATNEEEGVVIIEQLEEGKAIPANQGVILVGQEAKKVTMLPVAGETIATVAGNALGHSAGAAKTLAESEGYILARGNDGIGFYVTAAGTLAMNKAYLNLANNASLSVEIRFEGTTAIEDVEVEEAEVKAIYDLQGRKVENPTKGIYIINGNKVLVK